MNKNKNKAFYTLLYIVTICCLMAIIPAQARDIRLTATRLSAKDGLSCNTVNSVEQDRDGFIWLATPNGMSRYDGYQFINFSKFNSNNVKKNNSSSSISQLMNDKKHGSIWGFTTNNILCCFDLETAHFADYFDIDSNSNLLSNRFMSSNGMWIYSAEFGARNLISKEGKLQAFDYTPENGKLISTRQLKLAEDNQHNIWIASNKGLNLITPDHQSKAVLKNKNIIVMTCDESTIAVLSDQGEVYLYNSQGKLTKRSQLPSMMGFVGKSRASFFWQGYWYIFTQEETFAMNLKTGNFHKPGIQIPNAMDKNPLRSYHFIYDKDGNAYLFGKKKFIYKKFHLLDDKAYISSRDKNFVAAEDAYGKVFITSYGSGLFVYDPKDDTLQQFSMQDAHPLFHSDFLLNIFIDRSGCIWIGTGDGVYCCREQIDLGAEYIKMEPESKREWSNYVRHISYIGNNKLIVSTRENKTYIYDLENQTAQFAFQTNACVYSYAIDPKGRTWIGTKGEGIIINGVKYSKESQEHPVASSAFYDVAFDKMGRAWLATWGAGLLTTQLTDSNKENLHFKSYLNKNGREAQIHDLVMDKKGHLWIASNNGIVMVNTNDRNINEKSFIRFNEDNNKLPVSEIDCGIEAKDGTLWFGSTKGVLRCTYNEKTQQLDYHLLNTTNGLTTNTIRSLAEDHEGNIWIGTEEGLARLNSKTLDIRSFQPGNNITSNNFTENCAITLSDGRLAFGVANSMLLLNPAKSSQATSAPHLKATITDMTINGVSVYNEESKDILSKALNYTKEISLPFNKNSLIIYFSNFDYPHIKNAMYQYYLEGLDNSWRQMTSVNHADFSDLQPGSYTLHLRTLNGSSQWSEETLLHINIQHPWYNTWWAWLIYLTIIGTISTLFYRSWRRNFDLNQQIEMEKQMSEFRIDFFTHISHEFRTPLAIIQSAVDKITGKDNAYVSKNTYQTLKRGTRRMQRLINQLMEFRKASTGNLKLALEETDIIIFIRNIYNDIRQVAQQKGINMSFTPWSTNYKMYFDSDKVETIVYNLLSNAVKYTPDKGTIKVKLTLDDTHITLSVEDNGPGIKPEREKDLFKPFMHGYASKGGMGIGLYTAKEMATLHHGTLTYQHSTDETLGGSLFTFTLPTAKEIYQAEDFAGTKAIINEDADRAEIDQIVKEMTPKAINNVTVMVIEDDPDMLQQIKAELSVYFHVETYMNGKTGYENIKKLKPALLITDIMLPEMSGYEIVSNMKADIETQNIPVIMLTAFDDANHILKAYKNFVDDYMVKPCNFKLLIARCLQFISADRKAKQSQKAEENGMPQPINETEKKEGTTSTSRGTAAPSGESKVNNEPTILMSTLDKKFKDKLEAIVAQHISDRNFNVDRLAELLNIGRTTAYNRTKSIMGVSPNMYIQNERLRIAAELLLEGEYTVAEISDKVGFSDATYFYKCFKNKYGVAPSKYGK